MNEHIEKRGYPVGHVLFRDGHGLALLHPDLSWSVKVDGDDMPGMAGLIGTYLLDYKGPQDGDPVAFLVHSVARATGGSGWHRPIPSGVLGDADGPSPPQSPGGSDHPKGGGGEPGDDAETYAAGLIEMFAENCGTGAGGFKEGNTCAGGDLNKETELPHIDGSYYNYKGQFSVKQVSALWQAGKKARDKRVHAELPLSEVTKYREYDRGTPEKESYLKELAADIKENGIKEPLVLAFGKNGKVMFIEGNHRLVAAKIAGLETVPVVFAFQDKVTRE